MARERNTEDLLMIKIRVAGMDYRNRFMVGIFQYDRENICVGEVKTIEFTEKDPSSSIYDPPPIVLGKNEVQLLMDDLWAAGVRPSSGEGNAGQLGATERHLEDMRKIAFKKLGLDKKGVIYER